MSADIVVKDVVKEFDGGNVMALRGASTHIKKGEFVAIMGASGSGKSTLLNLIGALDSPTSGSITVDGELVSDIDDPAEFRGRRVGFVFQLHNLIPTLSAIENVQVPMIGVEPARGKRRGRAMELLDRLGLSERYDHLPGELSGGERQRVAVARALANDPDLILADEPTGSLDSKSTKQLLDFFTDIHQNNGKTIVMVTHDDDVAAIADYTIFLKDGVVVSG